MKRILYIIVMFASVFLINGCEGPEGDQGPQGDKGATGAAGQDGTDGEDGMDGEDGLSFFDYDEITSSGNIKIVLEGTRPDETSFKDSIDYKFNYQYREGYNSWFYENYNGFYFEIQRFADPNAMIFSRMVSDYPIYLRFYDEYGDIYVDELYFEGTVLTSDHRYFNLYFYDENIAEYVTETSDYYFDATKGILKIKMKIMVPGSYNSLGTDLNGTLWVDVIVYGNNDR